ncbi:hypothetical protein L6R52_19485 [Myxococcota bacterium]|nr:hypothetical protein [Myxococcota bacterium]
MTGTPPRERWSLSGTELDGLLTFLAPLDADRGRAYARAAEMLESFFRWRGLPGARELADVTLDRVARKLAEGEVVTAAPMRYALGVARLVLLEETRRSARERGQLATLVASEEERAGDEPMRDDARMAALEDCARSLSDEDRRLLLDYHRDDGRARIDGRQALANRLGLTLNGLRVRTFRIRARLLKCIEAKRA